MEITLILLLASFGIGVMLAHHAGWMKGFREGREFEEEFNKRELK